MPGVFHDGFPGIFYIVYNHFWTLSGAEVILKELIGVCQAA